MRPYDAALRMLQLCDVLADRAFRVLRSLGEAARESGKAIQEANEWGNEEYLEFAIDEETDVIEHLLGAMFVVCQAHITQVVSAVIKLHRSAQKNDIRLSSTDGSKGGIVRTGSDLLAGTVFSKVEVLDAFANYYKHRHQWPHSWRTSDPRATRTIDVIRAAGACPGCTGNLRIGAEPLGNSDYDDAEVFITILEEWREQLCQKYEKELNSRS